MWELFPTEAKAKTVLWLSLKKKDANSVGLKVFVVFQLPYMTLDMAQENWIATPTSWALPRAQVLLVLFVTAGPLSLGAGLCTITQQY